MELLRQLNQSGNFGAKEFCEHIDAMQRSMAAVRTDASTQDVTRTSISLDQEPPSSMTQPGLTAGMALADSSLQDFLAETNVDVQGFDNSLFDDLGTLYWPETWSSGNLTTENLYQSSDQSGYRD